MLQNWQGNPADSSAILKTHCHVHVMIVAMPTMRAALERRPWSMINCKQIRCRACNGQGTRNFTANPPPKHLTFLEYQETEVNRRDGRYVCFGGLYFSHVFFDFWFPASLLLCFHYFPCFFASLLFPASLLLCLFAFTAFLLLCLSASLLSGFIASLPV